MKAIKILSKYILMVTSFFRAKESVLFIRGRFCSVTKMNSMVYRVTVLNTKGEVAGSRFIQARFLMSSTVDDAVRSVLFSAVTY